MTLRYILFLCILPSLCRSQDEYFDALWKGRVGEPGPGRTWNVELRLVKSGDSVRGLSYYHGSGYRNLRMPVKGYVDPSDGSLSWWHASDYGTDDDGKRTIDPMPPGIRYTLGLGRDNDSTESLNGKVAMSVWSGEKWEKAVRFERASRSDYPGDWEENLKEQVKATASVKEAAPVKNTSTKTKAKPVASTGKSKSTPKPAPSADVKATPEKSVKPSKEPRMVEDAASTSKTSPAKPVASKSAAEVPSPKSPTPKPAEPKSNVASTTVNPKPASQPSKTASGKPEMTEDAGVVAKSVSNPTPVRPAPVPVAPPSTPKKEPAVTPKATAAKPVAVKPPTEVSSPKTPTPKPAKAEPKVAPVTVATKPPAEPAKTAVVNPAVTENAKGTESVLIIEPSSSVEKLSTLRSRERVLMDEVVVHGDTLWLNFYDPAEVDGDTVSVYLGDRPIATGVGLGLKPHVMGIPVVTLPDRVELTMHAENLGSIPPNTALLVLYIAGERREVRLESSERTSATVRFLKPAPVKR